MSGWVCHLQLLLALASAVILESCGTHDQILLSDIQDSLNLEGYMQLKYYKKVRCCVVTDSNKEFYIINTTGCTHLN
jgi:hypothetical protein